MLLLLVYTIVAAQGLRATVGGREDGSAGQEAAAVPAWFFPSAADAPLVGSSPVGTGGGDTAKRLLRPAEGAVLLGILGVELFSVLHPWIMKGRLPFLPLMCISVYCAGGLVWAWLRLGEPYFGALGVSLGEVVHSEAKAPPHEPRDVSRDAWEAEGVGPHKGSLQTRARHESAVWQSRSRRVVR